MVYKCKKNKRFTVSTDPETPLGGSDTCEPQQSACAAVPVRSRNCKKGKRHARTGAPLVIIHRRPSAPPVLLFELAIDPDTGQITVQSDSDISKLGIDDSEEGR